MRRFALRDRACLLVSVGTLLPGCIQETHACTLIGCASGMEIQLQAPSWPQASYDVQVVTDGATRTCTVALPFSCDTRPSCVPAEGAWVLGLSGCMLGPGQESLSGVILNDAPGSIDVQVRRDGKVVGQAHAEPTYRESRPNGPDCEPVCRTAPSITLPLD